MAELKTKVNDASVDEFLARIPDPARRADSETLAKLMRQATGAKAEMWGTSIVGFGRLHYVYASGREGEWFLVGFSPRKENLTLYLMGGLEPHAAVLEKLGKHKVGGGCVYIKRLEDVNRPALKQLIAGAVKQARRTRGGG